VFVSGNRIAILELELGKGHNEAVIANSALQPFSESAIRPNIDLAHEIITISRTTVHEISREKM
jgi:hypothetical protein